MEFLERLKQNCQTVLNTIRRKVHEKDYNQQLRIPITLDLSDKKIGRIHKNTNNAETILFNDFVSQGRRENSFNYASYFKNTPPKYVGGTYIPFSRITTFWGEDDGKFKSGYLDQFSDSAIITPNRSKYIGKVVKVIPHEDQYAYITEQGDTVPEKVQGIEGPKRVFADENGNTAYTYGMNDVDYLNTIFQQRGPMYPVLIDNGRYGYHMLTNPKYRVYTSNDFGRPEHKLFILGTINE